MKERYPRLEISLDKLVNNVSVVVERCRRQGVEVMGVIKGATGLPEVAMAYDKGGATMIASSRLEQIEDAIKAGIKKPMVLIRIPMPSEVDEVVRLTDMSLNSELEVIKALNDAAARQGKKHKVIIMADLGDLREGYWDKDEMVETAVYVEKELDNIELAGVGTNVGCYGSILPTPEKLDELVAIAERIEARIGRRLEYVSGGATSSLLRVWDGNLPERVNMLRIGEGILLALDMDRFYHYDVSDMYQDAFLLKAQVIEVKDKPSHPVGTIAVDAFGHTPEYVDRGIRRRALLGVGKVDYGDPAELICLEKGIEVLGASSDHTIVDIEDAEKDYKVGDVMTFGIDYATIVYLTSSRNVNIVFV